MIGLGATAVLSMGVCGLGDSGGCPDVIAWSRGKIESVLAAVPFRTTRVPPEKEQLIRLYAPPAYSKDTSLNVQFVQSRPSRDWVTSSKVKSSNFGNAKNDWKVGSEPSRPTPRLLCLTPPPLNVDRPCTVVGVWPPNDWPPSNSNVLQAPMIKDPNASATLDIEPPHRE